jgi:hypothetical protein
MAAVFVMSGHYDDLKGGRATSCPDEPSFFLYQKQSFPPPYHPPVKMDIDWEGLHNCHKMDYKDKIGKLEISLIFCPYMVNRISSKTIRCSLLSDRLNVLHILRCI